MSIFLNEYWLTQFRMDICISKIKLVLFFGNQSAFLYPDLLLEIWLSLSSKRFTFSDAKHRCYWPWRKLSTQTMADDHVFTAYLLLGRSSRIRNWKRRQKRLATRQHHWCFHSSLVSVQSLLGLQILFFVLLLLVQHFKQLPFSLFQLLFQRSVLVYERFMFVLFPLTAC